MVFKLGCSQKKEWTTEIMHRFSKLKYLMHERQLPLTGYGNLASKSNGSGIMSMLDGFSGYNQVLVKKEDQHKTTFTSPWGTFEYLRMPFGLLNAGATFQRAMDYAFNELIGKIIEIY